MDNQKTSIFTMNSRIELLEKQMNIIQTEHSKFSQLREEIHQSTRYHQALKEQFDEMRHSISENFNKIEKKLNKLDREHIRFEAEKKLKAVMLRWILKYMPFILLALLFIVLGIFDLVRDTQNLTSNGGITLAKMAYHSYK